MSLKLVIDKKSQKVIYAESGKEFVDFLFSILSFPLGTFIRVSDSHTMFGSIGNLYRTVQNPSNIFIDSSKTKTHLLSPTLITNGVTPFLPRDTYGTTAYNNVSFYTCLNRHRFGYIRNALCSTCRVEMDREIHFNGVGCDTSRRARHVKEATFIITDDLVIELMTTKLAVALLTTAGVLELDDLEEMDVTVGEKEGQMLLTEATKSREVLTNVFLPKESEDDSDESET